MKKNNDKYDDFVSISCSRETARVIRSKIPHDSTVTKGEKIRKTILFWFVEISENEINVDNEKFDQWIDLIKFHFIHEVFKLTFSDFENRYEVISYHFFSFNSTYSVQWAMFWFARRHSKDSLMLMQINVLLENDRQQTRKMITEHRITILKTFKNVFRDVKKIERILYENKTFFAEKNS